MWSQIFILFVVTFSLCIVQGVKKNKRIEQLESNPQALTYDEIESLFKNDDYEIQRGKGSHKHIYHKKSGEFATIPIHGGDCKGYYKMALKNFYFKTNE